MTLYAAQKAAPPAAQRASPVAGRSAAKPRQGPVVPAGQADLPPKPDTPPQAVRDAEKPAKAATWSAGPKRRSFQRAYTGSGAGSSRASSAQDLDHLDDLEPTLPKNGRVSINHLLNFRLPPRQHGFGGSSARRSTGSSGWDRMTRERYLNANNRFVVQKDGNYEANLRDPDAAVDWGSVVQVIMPTSMQRMPTCPICLSEPVAPKCTLCGHVYCYPCILRHLSVAEKHNRRCPVCFDDIRERELRSVSFLAMESQTLPPSPTLERADVSSKVSLDMILMHRSASSTLALPMHVPAPHVVDPDTGRPAAVFPRVTDHEAARYAKILLAEPEYVAVEIFEREAMEMERVLQDNKDLEALERRYIEMARDTSLGRMHVAQTGQPAIHGVPIPAKGKSPSAASTPLTSPQSSFGSPPTFRSSPPVPFPGERTFHFYQAADGSHVYLHPLDVRILKQEFGDYAAFPPRIAAQVKEFEDGSVNSDLRKRFRYLGHLPLGCDVTLAEIVLDGIVSEATQASFSKELAARDERRDLKRKQAKEDEERQQREARRLQRIQNARSREGITAPVSAVGLADIEAEDEPIFDISDLAGAVPTYVTPTPTLSFARAIASPKAPATGGARKPEPSERAGRGQPPPVDLSRGVTIGHEMGKGPRNRPLDEEDDVDEDSLQYVYHRSSSSATFGLLVDDDHVQPWASFEAKELVDAGASAAEDGKKKAKTKKVTLFSNGGARRK
ncbi:hypothetical protein DFJ74DRAFT_710656 [Hyaloraphidium curvatum]|nr:hypothetical protein DFJ74DRAFT_710656 [Hyaloraphidium curvatum]